MDSATPLIILIKQYVPVLLASFFGSLAHALETVKKAGWKGWLSFLSDIVICSFVGYSFYHLSILVAPEQAVLFTSIGAYWGTRGFTVLRDWLINSVKANVK